MSRVFGGAAACGCVLCYEWCEWVVAAPRKSTALGCGRLNAIGLLLPRGLDLLVVRVVHGCCVSGCPW